MASNEKKAKMSPLMIIGLVLCLGGVFLMDKFDAVGMIMCLAGIPIAIVAIVQNLKNKK